jgi:hypothetical protein
VSRKNPAGLGGRLQCELPEISGIVSAIIICVGGCECRVEVKRESVWVGDKDAAL